MLVFVASVLGCGESGSNPPNLPEIAFEVLPQVAGPIRFEVIEVHAGDRVFRSLAGQEIVASAPFQIFVENGATPFGLTLRLLDSAPALVRYRLTGTAGPAAIIVDQPGVAVAVGAPLPSTAVAPRPEARIDICAPAQGQTDCSPFDGQSTFGVAFSGTVGDTQITRALGRASSDETSSTTPAVIFLPDPQDTIAAVIRAVDARRLRVQLVLDGVLSAASLGSGTVVVRKDL
ncbi:MAG: hypothetical protein N3C12_10465 [Candidatus Binatia bacterium]|nr:hypothetical protein [Candidatus Binatia bacterium]